MNRLTNFDFEGAQIRTLTIDEAPYFVGKDVATVLGYERPAKAIQDHVDDEDKDAVPIQDSIGRMQKTPVINESGMYSLILGSKLPSAKRFKRWVTSEVLPAIRKHGAYAVDQLLDDPDLAIKAFTALKEEREKRQNLELANMIQQQQIAELTPKATYYDLCLNCKDLLSITQIAKDYGKSAKWMNDLLHKKGIQFKQSGTWLLYQKYAQKGLTQSKTPTYTGSDGEIHTRLHTYWTQKGRIFIYDLLKADGILPTIEREDVGS